MNLQIIIDVILRKQYWQEQDPTRRLLPLPSDLWSGNKIGWLRRWSGTDLGQKEKGTIAHPVGEACEWCWNLGNLRMSQGKFGRCCDWIPPKTQKETQEPSCLDHGLKVPQLRFVRKSYKKSIVPSETDAQALQTLNVRREVHFTNTSSSSAHTSNCYGRLVTKLASRLRVSL